MKNNKGFTLIELLAVIIILAVVALIATPIVLNVVEDAKKSAASSESNMIISGLQNGCATKQMQSQLDGVTLTTDEAAFVTACTATTAAAISDAQIKSAVNTGKATVTAVTMAKGQVASGTIVSNGYTVTITAGVVGTPTK